MQSQIGVRDGLQFVEESLRGAAVHDGKNCAAAVVAGKVDVLYAIDFAQRALNEIYF